MLHKFHPSITHTITPTHPLTHARTRTHKVHGYTYLGGVVVNRVLCPTRVGPWLSKLVKEHKEVGHIFKIQMTVSVWSWCGVVDSDAAWWPLERYEHDMTRQTDTIVYHSPPTMLYTRVNGGRCPCRLCRGNGLYYKHILRMFLMNTGL